MSSARLGLRVGSEVFGDDPYRVFRSAGHVMAERSGHEFVLVVNFDEVRRVARDWSTFTSDTPFEVPIPHEHDVRRVRQLPIETDPPDHTRFRALTNPTFGREAVEAHAERVGEVVDAALERAVGRGRLDVVTDLALPTVNAALAATLGRPAGDAELWQTWGVHVFHPADGGTKRANTALDTYLEQVVDDAVADRSGPDFFGQLAAARIGGTPLTRDEMIGFGNLVFAGGRDTVVAAIATAFVVLVHAPEALAWLRQHPDNARTAVEEILRISTPLPYIGRHATTAATAGGCPVQPGQLVALGFGAANRDPAVFDEPGTCILDRRPNRHIAFGHGPHTCLGAHLARMELRVVLERVAARVARLRFAEPPQQRHLDVAGHDVASAFTTVVVDVDEPVATFDHLTNHHRGAP